MTKPSQELRSAMPEETKPMTKTFTNELTDAEVERLAILLEELGEAQQCIGKILRHGYESRNPLYSDAVSNRNELAIELGDVMYAIDAMAGLDVNSLAIKQRMAEKAKKIKPYLHHQGVINGD